MTRRQNGHAVASFDSASALLQATARALRGEGFSALGRPRPLRPVIRLSDRLPTGLRRALYAVATGFEGLSHDAMARVRFDAVADWVTCLYPERRYPAVIVGSSGGATAHLAAALGAPWLPQTFLVPLRRTGGGIDDPRGDLHHAWRSGEALVAANPDIQLHQMHDPSQDRLSLRYITYFRTKYRRLPAAYRRFLAERLEPGAVVIVADCTRRWPTTRLGDRYVFQFGAVGGMEPEEYVTGSPRVADYLARYDVAQERWDPPAPDGDSPEAEWGFERALLDDIEDLAGERGLRVLRLAFHDPEHVSPLMADFYREWNRRRGIAADRLLVESFILLEPHWTLRTGTVPFWTTFNARPSLDGLRDYLSRAEPFDEIRMMIFPHGTVSVGLPTVEEWRSVLRQARRHASFVRVNERAYPCHFASLAHSVDDIARDAPRYPLPPRLPPAAFERFCAEAGDRYPVKLVT